MSAPDVRGRRALGLHRRAHSPLACCETHLPKAFLSFLFVPDLSVKADTPVLSPSALQFLAGLPPVVGGTTVHGTASETVREPASER